MKKITEKSIFEYLNAINESNSSFRCLSRITIKIVEKKNSILN